MAQDRFVYFTKVPSREDVGKALGDYLGGVGKVEWRVDRFFVDLPGRGSHPAKRLTEVPEGLFRDERWIEVWIGDDCIDVMTRQQDELTNVVAAGFSAFATRFWGGRSEPAEEGK